MTPSRNGQKFFFAKEVENFFTRAPSFLHLPTAHLSKETCLLHKRKALKNQPENPNNASTDTGRHSKEECTLKAAFSAPCWGSRSIRPG